MRYNIDVDYMVINLGKRKRGRGDTFIMTSRFQDQKTMTSRFQDQKTATSRLRG